MELVLMKQTRHVLMIMLDVHLMVEQTSVYVKMIIILKMIAYVMTVSSGYCHICYDSK
jgi:pentose-5-phosphate-3-epimerase